MRKLVPLHKQSKKQRKEYNAKQRGSWNGISPVTRIVPNGKAYEEIDVWGIVIKTRLACLRLDDMKEFYSEEDLNEEGNQRR